MFKVHFVVSLGQFVKWESFFIHLFNGVWGFKSMCKQSILWEVQKDFG